MPEQQQFRINLQSSVTPAGEFEILAITSGVGNSLIFPEDVLKASIPLWDGAECFIDHSWYSRSIRDLAGICHTPVWNDQHKGIQLQLKPVGPSKALLQELGQQILADPIPGPDVGFSADVFYTCNQNTVTRILKVNSVDLVYDPARGGAFLRALNSSTFPNFNLKESFQMPESTINPNPDTSTGAPPAAAAAPPPELEQERVAMQALLSHQQESARLAQETEAALALRVQMCSYLLDSALSASRLPAPAQDRLRKQFSGKAFTALELQTAVDDSLQLVSELTASQIVQGPAGRIHAMFNTDDQIQAAVDDLFEVPRSPELKDLKTAKLSGIRELYFTLTGDHDLHGGYYRDRVQLATTADFTGLVKNALNKIVVNTWDALGRAGYDWWNRITAVEHFNSLQSITGTLVGTVGTLPTVAEGGPYTELPIGDSPETAVFTKYGGYIPLTLELIDRDETRKLRAYPRELAAAGLRKISALVAAVFTANAGIGPTMADTGALFNNTVVTTAGGHANLLVAALSAAEWDTVSKAVYDQPMLVKQASGYYGTGPKIAINPRYCVVPRALQLTAMKILYPTLENAANIYSENLQRGQPGDVVTVPEFTDAADWAAVCDPLIAPAIFVGERFGIMPEIFIASNELNGAVFTNDEHRLKVRHFLAVWVNDFRPLHKNNVAA